MKISIQGNTGSYSHIAATHFFGNQIDLLERDSFKEVFEDLKHDRADYVVIPIENSTYGSVFQNYDFLTEYEFKIIKEAFVVVNFHLIGNPESKFEDITELHTHPVAMGQLKKFFNENPQIKVIEYPDTAGAVKMIKDKKLKHAAAAASKMSAEIFKMKVLKEFIQDSRKNYTRFFCLSKKEEYDPTSNKTTIEFELGKEAGTLHKALESFANYGISLTKIESRPIMHTKWEYRFYIDALMSLYDSTMVESLSILKKRCRDFRILGTYKEGTYIDT